VQGSTQEFLKLVTNQLGIGNVENLGGSYTSVKRKLNVYAIAIRRTENNAYFGNAAG
jgi:hypothetical protein